MTLMITPNKAEKIADDILSAKEEEMLAISIMDMRGNVLAAKSKDSFKQAFGVTRNGDRYGGTLAFAALAVANEVKDIVAGEAQAIIAIYKNCKMMLLPIPSCEILVGFVFERSVTAEDHKIANEIESLVVEAEDTLQ